MREKAIAHTRKLPDGSWAEPQDLETHLRSVAYLAERFAEPFGNGDWARVAGIWHDLGKYKPAFQRYIREQSDYENLETAEGNTGKQHAIAGALYAIDRFTSAYGTDGASFGRVLAYIIAGHHTGLPDWNHEMGTGGAIGPRLKEVEHLKDTMLGIPPRSILDAALPESMCGQSAKTPIDNDFLVKNLHMWIRMLFSCLVDADFLDTEAYMEPMKAEQRGESQHNTESLKRRFDEFMGQLTEKASITDVNHLRREVLAQCRQHAAWDPGVFSLSVPTGGGKTLSGMAFALEHALRHGKNRIIVAIPYTSIIEQTAKQYREIFGDEAVLEHHSNVDPSKETAQSKLASENWDAPIVVTTNVQLFESLFAAKTSQCRKLHNIANSVVILDEAQMLPPVYLEPIVSAIKGLTTFFGCSVVLSTATQPAIDGRFTAGKAVFHGFAEGTVRELMDNPVELSRRLKRVEILRHNNSNNSTGERASWEEIANELSSQEKVLCIVNTRKDCLTLYELMPEGTIHLSALMCAEHRSQVISQIKERLGTAESLRVVSTQLVEAGVDIDFPVVYRALAGFDSIAQSAGRCNREGNLNKQGKLGKVVIFNPPKDAPAGLLRKGQDAGDEILRLYPELVKDLDPEVFERYFRLFYSKVNNFDEKEIMRLLTKNAEPDDDGGLKIQFRTAANRFSLIEDAGQVPVVVWYEPAEHFGVQRASGKELVKTLEYGGPNRDLMRRIQRFTVNAPERVVLQLVQNGALREVENMKGLYTQVPLISDGSEISAYDPVFGLRLDGVKLDAKDFMTW